MDKVSFIYLLIVVLALGILLGHFSRILRERQLQKEADLEESQNFLVQDQRGRQLYIHQSHILMAGFQSSTECINCGGNSKTPENLKSLIIPCSMELSVYDGNNKFKHSTGETNV